MGGVHLYWFIFTMPSEILLQLPLAGPPRLVDCANAVHGRVPVERYFSRGVWCLVAYHYHAELIINGRSQFIKPGRVHLIPPDSQLEFHFRGPSRHTYANFFLPKQKPNLAIPMTTDLGVDFSEFSLRLSEMTRWSLPGRQLRADARLADLLWQIVDFHRALPASGSSRHPAAEAAIEFIEEHLAEPLTVLAIARRTGISHNHLIRLFHAALGKTVVAYVRSRRALRARHLLEQTTLPMKSIARSVGVADAHSLNKLVRRELGVAPSQVRRRSSGARI
jgi:AraC family transcriptional regulator